MDIFPEKQYTSLESCSHMYEEHMFTHSGSCAYHVSMSHVLKDILQFPQLGSTRTLTRIQEAGWFSESSNQPHYSSTDLSQTIINYQEYN